MSLARLHGISPDPMSNGGKNGGKKMVGLTARKVESLKEPGMYGDGAGLYLCISKGGTKTWILRTTVYGHRRELGLGSTTLVPLAEAREEARRLRKVARAGGDPETVRNRDTITFEEAAKRVHQKLEPTWSNPKHAASWLSAVEAYAYPQFGKRPINKVGTPDILKVLEPIWTAKHETARRIMQRLSTIFDWAKVAGHYPHENPVNGVKKALGTVNAKATHMESMPWPELPAFMKELAKREGVSARTLEFVILTAMRSGEVRGTRWDEIDLKKKVWTVPGERMKRRIPHSVPLPLKPAARPGQRCLSPSSTVSRGTSTSSQVSWRAGFALWRRTCRTRTDSCSMSMQPWPRRRGGGSANGPAPRWPPPRPEVSALDKPPKSSRRSIETVQNVSRLRLVR
ncbi:hypothetical protein MASR2M74_09170 [Paracoccaceae bacterium]